MRRTERKRSHPTFDEAFSFNFNDRCLNLAEYFDTDVLKIIYDYLVYTNEQECPFDDAIEFLNDDIEAMYGDTEKAKYIQAFLTGFVLFSSIGSGESHRERQQIDRQHMQQMIPDLIAFLARNGVCNPDFDFYVVDVDGMKVIDNDRNSNIKTGKGEYDSSLFFNFACQAEFKLEKNKTYATTVEIRKIASVFAKSNPREPSYLFKILQNEFARYHKYQALCNFFGSQEVYQNLSTDSAIEIAKIFGISITRI